jgi:hypothetical protein
MVLKNMGNPKCNYNIDILGIDRLPVADAENLIMCHITHHYGLSTIIDVVPNEASIDIAKLNTPLRCGSTSTYLIDRIQSFKMSLCINQLSQSNTESMCQRDHHQNLYQQLRRTGIG